MNIYTYRGFDGKHESSRNLLAAAIDAYNEDEHLDCEFSGKELTEKIRLGEKGKPYIDGWRKFSVSHSENVWAVIIGEEECGLDVQYTKELDYARVGGRFFAKEDAEAVESGGKSTFFELWTRREALVKANGETVFADMPSVMGDFAVFNGEPWFLQNIELLDTDETVVAAMCIKGGPNAVHYYRLHI